MKTGDQGLPGEEGEKGPRGETGRPGRSGVVPYRYVQSGTIKDDYYYLRSVNTSLHRITISIYIGEKGDEGYVGSTGIDGPQGQKGDIGFPGRRGENGDFGLQGEIGLDGRPGK